MSQGSQTYECIRRGVKAGVKTGPNEGFNGPADRIRLTARGELPTRGGVGGCCIGKDVATLERTGCSVGNLHDEPDPCIWGPGLDVLEVVGVEFNVPAASAIIVFISTLMRMSALRKAVKDQSEQTLVWIPGSLPLSMQVLAQNVHLLMSMMPFHVAWDHLLREHPS